jgi:PhoH-like ATPase
MKNKKLVQDNGKKNYVIDTSVLLYDKESITAFRGNNVFIPMEVLDEIDSFKNNPGILGESARFVIRFLDEIRQNSDKKNNLSKGVYHEEHDINYRVIVHDSTFFEKRSKSIELSIADNRIITSALQIAHEGVLGDIIIVSKDINLRVKSDALGIHAEDYLRDNLDQNKFEAKDSVWGGKAKMILDEVDYAILEDFFNEKTMSLSPEDIERFSIYPNCFVEVMCGNKSAIARANRKCDQISMLPAGFGLSKVKPNDNEQRFAMAAILDPEIPLVSITGAPGSGKTYLALLLGIEQMKARKFERIIITRSIQSVGKEIGFLPGDVNDKMAPWMGPIMDNFRHIDSESAFEKLKENGKIEIVPLSYIRGRSFPNSYIIVDEAQNTTIHELKTIITRAGMNSKMVLIGDIEQIDTPYVNKNSNGLSVVIDRFKKSELSAHIHLKKGVRSELANEANKLL